MLFKSTGTKRLYVLKEPGGKMFFRELVPAEDWQVGDPLVPVLDNKEWAFRYTDTTIHSTMALLQQWHIPFEVVRL